VHVLKDSRKSALSVLILCLSPASVFLTMVYTESLFQFISLLGIWFLVVQNQPLLSGLAFSAGCLVRSNGASSPSNAERGRKLQRSQFDALIPHIFQVLKMP
jgi:hypothetical protein